MDKKYKKIFINLLLIGFLINLFYFAILQINNVVLKVSIITIIAGYIYLVYLRFNYYYSLMVFIISLIYFPLTLIIAIVISRSKYDNSINTVPGEDLKNIIAFQSINQYYFDLSQKIKSAKKSILFQKFVLRMDPIGLYFVDLLVKASRKGIQVDLILDELLLKTEDYTKLFDMIKNTSVNLILIEKDYDKFFKNLNTRNHRKIIVIDSEIIYIGGSNIATEYVGLNHNYPSWKDSHFRLENKNSIIESQAKIDAGITVIRQDNNKNLELVETQVFLDNQQTLEEINSQIKQAKNKIIVYSPYLSIPAKTLLLLKLAIKRGVKVKFHIPHIHDNKEIAYKITLDYANKLVGYGAEVYYVKNTFLHSKFIVMDDIEYFGSLNFDIRSFYFNKEIVIKYKKASSSLYSIKSNELIKYEKVKMDPITKLMVICLGILN
jgi:cardiolipin synthase